MEGFSLVALPTQYLKIEEPPLANVELMIEACLNHVRNALKLQGPEVFLQGVWRLELFIRDPTMQSVWGRGDGTNLAPVVPPDAMTCIGAINQSLARQYPGSITGGKAYGRHSVYLYRVAPKVAIRLARHGLAR